jgi:hypothetical protein
MFLNNDVEFHPIEQLVLRIQLALREMFIAQESHFAWLVVDTLSDSYNTISMVTLIAGPVRFSGAVEENL